jgi:hypothetical protein
VIPERHATGSFYPIFTNPILMKNYLSVIAFSILLLLIYPSFAFSQLNQWAWMNGHNNTNQYGVYGTAGICSATNQPGARSECASWKDAAGNFWLFGGVGNGTNGFWGALSDLWKFDPQTNKWTWMKGAQLPWANNVYGTKGIAASNNKPGARQLSCSWTDNAGNFWLFGGTGNSYYNDLWKYDINSNSWTWIHGDNTGNSKGIYGNKGIAASANNPGARCNAAQWKDKSGNFWLFGGNGYDVAGRGGYLNDLWKYDVASNMWAWISGDSVIKSKTVYGVQGVSSPLNKPGARTGATCWTDHAGNLLLLGGLGYASSLGALNDLWKFDLVTKEWNWIHGDSTIYSPAIYQGIARMNGSTRPGAILNAVAWSDRAGNSWVFGGRGQSDNDYGELNALWLYNSFTNSWTFINGDQAVFGNGVYGSPGVPHAANKPGAREKPVGWMDDPGNLWLFGGDGYPANNTTPYFHSDCWKLTLAILLPEKSIKLKLVNAGKNIHLYWNAVDEMNLDYYEVETSKDGIHFSHRATINPTLANQYEFHLSGMESDEVLFFRIRLVYKYGSPAYSNTCMAKFDKLFKVKLLVNPVNAYAQLVFNQFEKGKVQVSITDIGGRVIERRQYQLTSLFLNLPVQKLKNGIYMLKILYGEKTETLKMMVVQ